MATKQKTRVMLPGGIQGLVHNLQTGTADPALTPQVDVSKINDNNEEAAADSTQAAAEAAQNYASANAAQNNVQTAQTQVQTMQAGNNAAQTNNAAVAAGQQTYATQQSTAAMQPSVPVQGEQAQQQPAQRGRRPKENTMKEYTVVKDDSRDSWDLFLDMARQYKDGGGKLATIYIDESLKNVLDRMKYCGPEKLSTSAILSSIVARFIFDHEEDIKKVMFSGRLI